MKKSLCFLLLAVFFFGQGQVVAEPLQYDKGALEAFIKSVPELLPFRDLLGHQKVAIGGWALVGGALASYVSYQMLLSDDSKDSTWKKRAKWCAVGCMGAFGGCVAGGFSYVVFSSQFKRMVARSIQNIDALESRLCGEQSAEGAFDTLFLNKDYPRTSAVDLVQNKVVDLEAAVAFLEKHQERTGVDNCLAFFKAAIKKYQSILVRLKNSTVYHNEQMRILAEKTSKQALDLLSNKKN